MDPPRADGCVSCLMDEAILTPPHAGPDSQILLCCYFFLMNTLFFVLYYFEQSTIHKVILLLIIEQDCKTTKIHCVFV